MTDPINPDHYRRFPVEVIEMLRDRASHLIVVAGRVGDKGSGYVAALMDAASHLRDHADEIEKEATDE